jgi:hypothetical protein
MSFFQLSETAARRLMVQTVIPNCVIRSACMSMTEVIGLFKHTRVRTRCSRVESSTKNQQCVYWNCTQLPAIVNIFMCILESICVHLNGSGRTEELATLLEEWETASLDL